MSDGDGGLGDAAEAQTGVVGVVGGRVKATEGLLLMVGGLFCAVTFTSDLHLNSSQWIFLWARGAGVESEMKLWWWRWSPQLRLLHPLLESGLKDFESHWVIFMFVMITSALLTGGGGSPGRQHISFFLDSQHPWREEKWAFKRSLWRLTD